MVTFLFAGDGSLASEGLSAFLQTKSNYMLVAECRDGAIAIGKIESLNPQVAVIDAHLPDLSANEIAAQVRAKGSRTKIVVLGLSANREEADRVLRAGADAYIVRSGPSRHLTAAIRCVQGGGKYLDPQLTATQATGARPAEPPTNGDAIAGLWAAIESRARTVERLEQAMSRAECAIGLLQQKLEQLAGAPIEVPPTPPEAGPEVCGEKQSLSARLRTGVGAVAAFCLSERLDSNCRHFAA
jgi:DNA-binding NarL/FixJ family response regulator